MVPSSHVFFSWFHSIIINCYSVSKTKHADLLLASLSDTYLWMILWTTSLVPEWIDVRFNCFCCAFSVLWWADFLTSLFQPIKARLTVRLAVPAHAFPPLAPVHLFSEKHDWIVWLCAHFVSDYRNCFIFVFTTDNSRLKLAFKNNNWKIELACPGSRPDTKLFTDRTKLTWPCIQKNRFFQLCAFQHASITEF